MPEDEEIEEDDPKKRKAKKKNKKKKGKSQEEDGDGDLDGLPSYWPAPENLVLDQPPGQDEEWVDITSLCEQAVSGMNLGEMIESDSFRLFDAMSAIEIMDPKMDTGYKSLEDMTIQKAQEQGLFTVEPEHLAQIMDQLLMYYLLWLDGHTIVQTVYSCIYLQEPARLTSEPGLASFVDAFLIACTEAKNAVNAAGVWDDEDFMPTMFNVDFQVCVFSSDPVKAVDLIKKQQLEEPAQLRLEFIGNYMSALVALSLPKARSLQTAKGMLSKCSLLLQRMEQSAVAPCEQVKRRFDASLNRKLLVPGPPRQVQAIEDLDKVFSMWREHLSQLILCCSLHTRPLEELLFKQVLGGKANVLCRSIAQVIVSEPGFLRQAMREALELQMFPSEALQHCKKQAEPFLKRCESMFLHMLKLSNLNVTRRFRRLAHVFLDFNELQHEAWRLDETLQSTFAANLRYQRPSWGFIMDQGLSAQISKLLLGFQLDIYEEAELHMIYWYVDYLCGLRIYYLNEMHSARESAKKKKNPKEVKSKPKSPPLSLVVLEATQSVVRGLFRLLAFCLCQDLLSSPKSVRAGLSQRFVLRFRSLEMFRLPHLPSYQDFVQSALLAEEASERRQVLGSAATSFTEAAGLLEKANQMLKEQPDMAIGGELRALKRVTVANQLAITQLQRLEDAELATRRVVPETAHHPELISIQLVQRA